MISNNGFLVISVAFLQDIIFNKKYVTEKRKG